ncbi:hypothetical protein SLEP1_g1682 [Rubroshorea leprosula]|uniref:Uncharacterized protein n=1 Tax=Rubroshorea leprosula TaxID=152421 RepID=A0AAV5HKH1_9ROSI|nr:hypothetical protein SLEP1_g1682 [Rubroshorea leprosula]
MSSSFTSTSSSTVNYVPAVYPDMMSSFCMWTMRSNLVINGRVSHQSLDLLLWKRLKGH